MTEASMMKAFYIATILEGLITMLGICAVCLTIYLVVRKIRKIMKNRKEN